MKRIAPAPVNNLQQFSEGKESSPAKRHRSQIVQICTICQEVLTESVIPLTILPCGHIFHLNCSEQWLKRKPLCPNCRLKIFVDVPIIPSSSSESSDSESNDSSDSVTSGAMSFYESGSDVEDISSDSESNSNFRLLHWSNIPSELN